jgi:hypothetical protein
MASDHTVTYNSGLSLLLISPYRGEEGSGMFIGRCKVYFTYRETMTSAKHLLFLPYSELTRYAAL